MKPRDNALLAAKAAMAALRRQRRPPLSRPHVDNYSDDDKHYPHNDGSGSTNLYTTSDVVPPAEKVRMTTSLDWALDVAHFTDQAKLKGLRFDQHIYF